MRRLMLFSAIWALCLPAATGFSLAQSGTGLFGATCEDALIGSGQAFPVLLTNTTASVFDDYQYGTACDGDIPSENSGVGSDRAHLIMVDHSCRIRVTMQSSPGVDLSLFVTNDCDDTDACIGSDTAGEGGVESVELDVESFTPIYIIVDGSSGSAGSYVLAVREAESSSTGCGMVPVELQSFTIE